MDKRESYARSGFVLFDPDPTLTDWVLSCRPIAEELPNLPDAEFRCGGTWFPGVNILPNDPDGSIPGGVPPLAGAAWNFIRAELGFGHSPLDRAQISITYQGYPQQGEEDSEAAFGYRLKRDAAHIDGLARDKDRRRRLSEIHSFILGIPLTESTQDQSPLVVWPGSHHILRKAFREALAEIDPIHWRDVDITDAYIAARSRVFETCERISVAPGLGGAAVLHPLTLHGVAPWREGDAPRIVAYFRPDAQPGASPARWLAEESFS